MNQKERAALRQTLAGIDVATLMAAQSAIAEAAEAEREKFDGLTEGLQVTQSGQRIEAMADLLEEQAADLESAIDAIEQVICSLEGELF
ncbi:hypothetical protein UFOVP408_48 [uncultured Caudovirales phage]|uniref:Uncharacterized protein n=1 Tax=uncultured Caudovirales phage TaxID=2100421 RepID=A0A6J5M120_9CAUD|nr:hypothetical protein UFOVP356_45 [uncultured Caudovirales phage]CAB4140643.1 hypothetical protein UFOVP408_48 [uncultured Caudovirales phage]CAB4156908.1 hypothetical protein UFOVP676_25 [uncultured Caudovirales phage]